jgi:hypothetical protein
MFKKVLKWVTARARERSTYSGLAMIAAIAGAPALGLQLDHIGQAIVLITGGGLMAATTQAAG